MLTIVIPGREHFDEDTSCFINEDDSSITLTHSLVTISKWESKWMKPFLSTISKTNDETLDYIRCMSASHIDDKLIDRIGNAELELIREFIEAPMTATVISNNESKGGKKETITSELIYYWMVALNIPFECQYWHLNRLITLVNVCNIKNTPPKKMSKRETMSSNAELNAARKKAMSTPG